MLVTSTVFHPMNRSSSQWSLLVMEEECQGAMINEDKREDSKETFTFSSSSCRGFPLRGPFGLQSLRESGLRKRHLVTRGAQGAIYAAYDMQNPAAPREVIVKRLYRRQDSPYGSVGMEVNILREVTLLHYVNQQQAEMYTPPKQERTLAEEGSSEEDRAVLPARNRQEKESTASIVGSGAASRGIPSPPVGLDDSASILGLYRIVEGPLDEVLLVLESCDTDLADLCFFSTPSPPPPLAWDEFPNGDDAVTAPWECKYSCLPDTKALEELWMEQLSDSYAKEEGEGNEWLSIQRKLSFDHSCEPSTSGSSTREGESKDGEKQERSKRDTLSMKEEGSFVVKSNADSGLLFHHASHEEGKEDSVWSGEVSLTSAMEGNKRREASEGVPEDVPEEMEWRQKLQRGRRKDRMARPGSKQDDVLLSLSQEGHFPLRVEEEEKNVKKKRQEEDGEEEEGAVLPQRGPEGKKKEIYNVTTSMSSSSSSSFARRYPCGGVLLHEYSLSDEYTSEGGHLEGMHVSRPLFPVSDGVNVGMDSSSFPHAMASTSAKTEGSIHRPSCCPLLRAVPLLRYLMRRFLRILSFLHDTCHVCHRDVKPSNWLVVKVKEEGNDIRGGGIRLGDFGSACLLPPRYTPMGKEEVSNTDVEDCCISVGRKDGNSVPTPCPTPLTPATFRTTRTYMAPECILGKAYGYKADIWSIGVTFVELLLQRHLFSSASEIGVLSEIYTLLLPSNKEVNEVEEENDPRALWNEKEKNEREPCHSLTELDSLIEPLLPPEGVAFVHSLLTLAPDQRLSASKALAHPFLHFEGWQEDDKIGETLWRQKLETAFE